VKVAPAAWTVGAAALLAGCAATTALPPVPPREVPAVKLPAAWSGALTTGTAVDLSAWWQAFNDADLNALVATALATSPEIDASSARVRAARALAQESAARLGPQLSFSGTSQQSADGGRGYFLAGLDARWDLPLWSRDDWVRGGSAADVQLALIDEQATRATLVAEVAAAYFQMRAAEREQQVLRDMAALADERSRLTKALVQTRQLADDELPAASAAALQARAALAEPAWLAVQARARLALLLGDLQAQLPKPLFTGGAARPAQATSPTGSRSAVTALRVAELPADLLRQRPAIRRAEQTVLRAAYASGLAHADAQPRISLSGLLGMTLAVTGPGSGTVRGTLGLGPAFSIPLFDGGERVATQTARNAEFDVATAQYRQEVLVGVSEAQTALLQLDYERQRGIAAAAVENALRERTSAIETRMKFGLADGFQRTAARSAVLAATQQALRLALAEQIAYVAVFKAFGGAALMNTAVSAAASTSAPTNAPTGTPTTTETNAPAAAAKAAP
jgi:outer membrane protein, multidrug efflux system